MSLEFPKAPALSEYRHLDLLQEISRTCRVEDYAGPTIVPDETWNKIMEVLLELKTPAPEEREIRDRTLDAAATKLEHYATGLKATGAYDAAIAGVEACVTLVKGLKVILNRSTPQTRLSQEEK